MPRDVKVVEPAVVRAEFEAEARRASLSAFARRAGISVTSVSRAMAGGGLGVAIPRALGYVRVVGYARIVQPDVAARLAPGDAEIVARVIHGATVLQGLDGRAATPTWARPRPVPIPVDLAADSPFAEPPRDIEQAVLGARVREANAPEAGDEEDDE